MTTTLWIVVAVSIFCIIGFVLVIRSQLKTNREIDNKIDYTKLQPWDDDEEDEEKKW